jgi:hypothetical protein
MRRHFLAIIAGILSLPETLTGLKWLFGWVDRALQLGEHAEFIGEHAEIIANGFHHLEEWIPEAPRWISLPALVIGLAIFVGISIRGRNRQPENRSPEAPLVDREPPALQLSIGEKGRFVTRKSDGFYKTKRTVHVRLSNNGASRAVGDCKVQITRIEPEFPVGFWVLKDKFIVTAGDDIYIPLARYSEADDPKKSDYHDSVIEICMPDGMPILRTPRLQTEERNRVTIKATGMDTPPVELRCELWIDEKGQLRVQSVGRAKAQITLREAALRAHEQLHNHDITGFIQATAKTESDLLEWYCGAMISPHNGKPALVTLHGRQPPSRIIEPIDDGYLLRYDFSEVRTLQTITES